MKLGKMMIFVSDLAAAKDFYVEILGFPMLAETADRLDLEHDGCDLVLFRCGKDSVIQAYGMQRGRFSCLRLLRSMKLWLIFVITALISYTRHLQKTTLAAMPPSPIPLEMCTKYLNVNDVG